MTPSQPYDTSTHIQCTRQTKVVVRAAAEGESWFERERKRKREPITG